MDALRYLLDEVHRLRVLVCAYREEDDPAGCAVTLEELYEVLELASPEGSAIVAGLVTDGLLQRVPMRSGQAAPAVQLSRLGRERLASFGRPGGSHANAVVVNRRSRATV